MFKYSLDNKRYHTLNYYFRNRFNSKVAKIPLDANLECPNKLSGGCIYCSYRSKSNITDNKLNLLNQFYNEIEVYKHKWKDMKYIAYFQAGSNTYGNIFELKELYELFLNVKDCVGICIATRPDLLSEEVLDYFNELNKKTFLMVEVGVQTSNNKTLEIINRGHSFEESVKGIKALKKRNIFTCVHIINGLPNDTKEDMINTIIELNKLNIDAIKIHMLYVPKNTKIANMFLNNEFKLLTKEEYIYIVCEQLTYLNPEVVIERITGDPVKEELIEPTWLLKKFVVLNDIDKEMVKRDIYEGSNL